MSNSSEERFHHKPITLATVLAALDRSGKLSATRKRDLRSAVTRVADLLGDEPAGIVLDLPVISSRLNTINPVALGFTAKRFANIRSDFLAATRLYGAKAVATRGSLSPEWGKLFERVSGRRSRLGLSRLARYASLHGIKPLEINDDVIAAFIAAVREGSLHRNPNKLHRQVTLVWNEVAAARPELSYQLVTVASFRGPPKRLDWRVLSSRFRRNVDDYLSWAGGSDPFDPDARIRPLASRTLRLRRDQVHAAVTALVDSARIHAPSIRSPISLRPTTLRAFCASGWRWWTAAKTFSITCLPTCCFRSRANGSKLIQRFSPNLRGWFARCRCPPRGSQRKISAFCGSLTIQTLSADWFTCQTSCGPRLSETAGRASALWLRRTSHSQSQS